MRPKSRQRLVDARRYASRALGVLERFGEGLAQDVDACMALERAVEVMGEAMRALSQDDPEFHAAHRDLPWRETIRLLTKLAHGYTKVEIDYLIEIVRDEFPAFIAKLDAILGDAP
jgi:uncharacterized protein with HEPN domain